MAKVKSGGLKKRIRTPAQSAAQRNRSYRNKANRRKAHAKKYPNDTKSLLGATRWTADTQKTQKSSISGLGGK